MVWHETVNLIANVATAIGVFLAALGLLLAKRQRQTVLEDSLTKEYRQIIYQLPVNALLGDTDSGNDKMDLMKEMYSYIDFTNEQAFLRKKGRIRKSTWLDWVDGIKSNLQKPAFRDAWEIIKDKSKPDEFTELRNLEHSDYEIDPKEWRLLWIKRWLHARRIKSAKQAKERIVQKTDMPVQDLVSMIERGELRLPEMQRGYVWRATRVRDLLDSLYRRYPSGNILVWESDAEPPLRSMAVKQNENPYKSNKLLLDGQQRLTSLSAILRGDRVTVKGKQKPIDILFNLDHPDNLEDVLEVEDDENNDPAGLDDDDDPEDALEERIHKLTFVVSNRRTAALPNWASVTEIFKNTTDAPFLKKAGVNSFEDPKYDKYTKRLKDLRAIREYPYSVHILGKELSYEEVTEIFVRVNSLGAKLRSSDLALAQVTARWRGALAVFEEFEEECKEADFPLPIGLLVRAMVVEATNQSRFKTVTSLSIEDLQSAWESAQRGLRFAIHFLKNNSDIESPALLTSPYIAIALCYFANRVGQKMTSEQVQNLRFWIQVANGRGRYSRGSSESLLDQDIAFLRDNKGITALIDALRQQFGRLHFDVEELRGRNQRASVFRLMFLAMKSAKARDWNTGIGISVGNYGTEHKLQFHHIFPKAQLRGIYDRSQINDIGNLAFISGKTNRNISAKPPSEYLPKVIEKFGQEALMTQCVPTDTALWSIDRYPEFLTKRHELVLSQINKYIGTY